jgi:drug/metabolite transporter (DMT)-like permease
MTQQLAKANWLLFIALGFMWGSSYLFIKLAVDDFGTFTLVALRLLVGAILLWAVVLVTRQELPREPRIYGHLFVMGLVNIVIPFALITWAEQTVDSSLAAILTAPVPLFAIVIAPLFLHDEPIRVNGVVGLVVGFIGVVILTSRDLTVGDSDLSGEVALLGAAFSYAVGAVYARRNMRGVHPLIPAVFQVSFALLVAGAIAILAERPWDARPDAEAIFSILWLGVLGSGLAYLVVFRLFAAWGATRTTMVAYEIPVWGIVLGFLVLAEPIDVRLLIGTALVVGGVALVNSP